MDCPFCKMPYMEWRLDENTSKTKIWDGNIGIWHDCKESPQAKKQKADSDWSKKRDEVLRHERLNKIAKLKAVIFCYHCEKGIKASSPCKHLIEDGFEFGKDGGDFYSDSYKSKQRRKLLKKPKIKNTPNHQRKLL